MSYIAHISIDCCGDNVYIQHASTCNDGFPVLNYTLEVGGRLVAELNASDYAEDTVSVTISSLEIPTLTLGQQYSVIITACNKFTCRSSKTPLAVGKHAMIIPQQ